MEREQFISRKEAYNGFIEWRKKLNNAQNSFSSEEGFSALFEEAVQMAGDGDAVMQDVVAYYYKSGVFRRLDEDYKKYMEWEILSAAAGNEFAIEKLQFFLGYAYDQIVESPDFPKIKYYNGIDEYNYIAIIGQQICEALAEKLGLDAKTLSKTKDIYQPYQPEYFRDYRKAVDEVINKVIDIMKKKGLN